MRLVRARLRVPVVDRMMLAWNALGGWQLRIATRQSRVAYWVRVIQTPLALGIVRDARRSVP